MIGHLHYIMSSKYELFLFILLSVALVIINYQTKKNARPMNVFLGGVNYVSKIILTINYNIEHNS